MKYLASLIILSIGFLPAFGQGAVTLTGQVKDELSNNPLEFCNVSYYSFQDSLISGTATDQRGYYTSDLPMGNYKQIISYVGNLSDTAILYAYESKFLGIYSLKTDVHLLGEASITKSSRSSEIDRDVQVVTKEMKAGAFSAKYVMNKLNGVHYDEFNNSIKVDNDDRVIILVDGIQKDQEYVKNLSPDRLKKIEVIRDPAGRYGMEGYTAVINIILNKDYMGIEVLLQERGLFDSDALKKEYIPVQNNPNATLTYTYNKMSVYGKVGSTYANYNMDSYESKSYNNGLSIEKTPAFDDDASIRVKQLSTDYTLGADYFLNPRHTLSYEGKIINSPEKSNMVEVYQTVNTLMDGNLIGTYDSEVGVRSSTLNTYNSLFYEGKLNDRNTLKSHIVYSNYANNQVVDVSEQVLDQFSQEGSDSKSNTSFYLDYEHTFKDNSNLLIGYGNTWENLSSEIISNWQENEFETQEWRNKLYGYYTRQVTKKFSFKLGAAGETSARLVNARTNNYLIFLPHADFKYDFTQMFNIKLKLRSDGKYPTINQTNPFTTFVDYESVQTGNPDLMPEVTNRLSLQASLFQNSLTIEPYYHFSKNMIITTGMLRADSVFEYHFHNAGYYRNYGVKANFSKPIGKIFYFQSSFDIYNSSVEFEQYSNEVIDWAASGQLIYIHQKSKSIAGLGYQKNNNKKILAQGYQQQNVDFWMVLVRRPFFKEKLSVMLLYFAPISLGVDNDQVKYIETDTYKEIETTSMGFFKNMVMVEISYRFNKGKVIKKDKEVDYIREKENKSMF
jgi:hypothetical protein